MVYNPWGGEESDMTERLTHTKSSGILVETIWKHSLLLLLLLSHISRVQLCVAP